VIATHDESLMELFPARRLRLELGHVSVDDRVAVRR
jgi:hypothetical protein